MNPPMPFRGGQLGENARHPPPAQLQSQGPPLPIAVMNSQRPGFVPYGIPVPHYNQPVYSPMQSPQMIRHPGLPRNTILPSTNQLPHPQPRPAMDQRARYMFAVSAAPPQVPHQPVSQPLPPPPPVQMMKGGRPHTLSAPTSLSAANSTNHDKPLDLSARARPQKVSIIICWIQKNISTYICS